MRARYAILLDGGFVTKKLYERTRAEATADDVETLCTGLMAQDCVKGYELLRIYYYDAPPSEDTVKKPVSGERHELSKTSRYAAAQRLYGNLVLKPYFALRMGHTAIKPAAWRVKPRSAKTLIAKPRPLEDTDFDLDIEQKGVDMRIGLDLARLALRDMVRAVIVVTGDSDFVPAFKFVRREGVQVILEPLGHNVRPELREHSDLVL